MKDWIVLSRQEHVHHGYRARQGFAHAAEDAVVPILVAELPRVVPHYVLAFIQRSVGCLPVALLGTADSGNQYLAPDNRWLADYVPAALRGFPFALAAPQDDDPAEERALLAIHRAHLVEGAEGEPLMDDSGELMPRVEETARFLRQCQLDRRRTMAAARQLLEADVLVEWPVTLPVGPEREAVRVNGLYRVDMDRLEGLPEDAFSALRGPALRLAHAQHFTSANLDQLQKRAAYQESASPREAEPPPELRNLLGDMEESSLSFDFD